MRPHHGRDVSPHHSSDDSQWIRRAGEFLSIPLTLASAPTIGFLAGWFLDRAWGTFPWLTVVLLVLGFVAGVREVWRAAKRTEKDGPDS